METSTEIPEAIRTLVQGFEFHLPAYKRGQYKEEQVKQEFITPFFKALGWDIDNNKRYSELYKEVILQDPIRIRGQIHFIDYSFRIGGTRKFLVEAKDPKVNIAEDAGPALQLRRYAWNARLPLSILTDFEEFAVYDCTKKPMPGDSATTARVAYFTYKDYAKRWEWISSIFSQESILQGSFDQFAQETKGKKGTATVDEAILADIEEWRDALARNLALRNPALSVDELNVAVQRTIDRILFLRICEDRGIEEYGCLQKLLDGQDVYLRLLTLFQRADTRYNSGIFHFSAERGRDELPDTLTPALAIDDAVLKKIIKRLYYPESPYEFSVISPVILGQVYEQFLGKVIRLTAGHQAKVEYKPEVKKAGGVYYTPQCIVDYIVKHTVGELVKDKTPREVASLRILDPACGSGSFLLEAYQYLLDWHLEYYIHNLVPVLADKPTTAPEVQALLPERVPKTAKKKYSSDGNLPIYKSANQVTSRTRSDWKLTSAERKRILLNNIYGVDIDPQAVEVTKLSLLLKVLEEENEENVSKQLKLFDERVLPSLHENIKCGNSLIGTDIYSDMLLDDPDEVKRINAFDWEREFPGIMKIGGFDAVIGNPPWGASVTDDVNEYIRNRFAVADGRSYDTYSLFIERGLSLARMKGIISYITPDTFLRKDDHYATRRLIFETATVQEMIETGPIFSKVRDTWALIFRFIKENPVPESTVIHKKISRFTVSAEERLEQFASGDLAQIGEVPQAHWRERPMMIVGYLSSLEDQKIIRKMEDNPCLECLGDLYRISRGEEGSKFNIQSSENGDFLMVIPRDISRYDCQNGIKVQSRTLTENKRKEFYTHPKIWIIRIQKMRWKQRLVATYDDRLNSCGMKTLQIIVSVRNNQDEIKYLLGVISSNLMNYYCINYLADDMNKSYLSRLPIRPIDRSISNDVAKYDRMVALVDRMLALHKRQADIKTDHERNLVERQIEATDWQIDSLVYELYSLTDDEIRIVEGARM